MLWVPRLSFFSLPSPLMVLPAEGRSTLAIKGVWRVTPTVSPNLRKSPCCLDCHSLCRAHRPAVCGPQQAQLRTAGCFLPPLALVFNQNSIQNMILGDYIGRFAGGSQWGQSWREQIAAGGRRLG